MKISQCMIVKNEEKNIERALTWGKGIVFEQIVVDTGSTDRTVELAKKLGAKVYHFKWIDDFAAAKNYAIEQATGDWIAFLDADEYMMREDAEKLPQLLEEALQKQEEINVIRSDMFHLGTDGNIFAVLKQARIFKNVPYIRYAGRIHEQIECSGAGMSRITLKLDSLLPIYHTGYVWTEKSKKEKSERNGKLIQRELEKTPESAVLQLYFSETLVLEGKVEEALTYAKKAVENTDKSLPYERISQGYFSILNCLFQLYHGDKSHSTEFCKYYEMAVGHDEKKPDFDAAMTLWSFETEDYEAVICHGKKALEKMQDEKDLTGSMILEMVEKVYQQLMFAYGINNDIQQAFYYGTLALKENPYEQVVLTQMLQWLIDNGEGSTESILRFFSPIYQVDKEKDVLFLIKCARLLSLEEVEEILLQFLPEEMRLKIAPPRESILQARENETATDHDFYTLMNGVYHSSLTGLVDITRKNILKLREQDNDRFNTILSNYNYWAFWGAIDPDRDNWELLENRAGQLKEHMEDIVWLYERLSDWRSRKTLLGLMEHWITYSRESLCRIVENMNYQYFEPDIMLCNSNDVIVDIGGYIGDTYQTYTKTYGENAYKRYYCYEALPENVEKILANIGQNENLIVRQKAVSNHSGYVNFYVNEQFNGANKISDDGNIEIEAVTIDEDIDEPVTLIKMDIEGAEKDALEGCRHHIQEEHPKLAISIYHSNEDLWKIPRLIDGMYSGYKFYLRYNGGLIYPSEYVLIAVPEA